MEQRVNAHEVAPDAYRAMIGLEQYVGTNLDKDLVHLIKLRASFVNSCAFCVDMHSTEAMSTDIDPRKLFAVSAWHESPFFSERERAALALTDEVTLISEGGVSDEVWDDVVDEFDEKGAMDVLMAAVTINAWNRIAITTRTKIPALGGPDTD